MSKRYWWEAFQDKDSLEVQLFNAHREALEGFERERELAAMEQRIYERVMKDVKIQFKNDASPEIQKLKNEIQELFSK